MPTIESLDIQIQAQSQGAANGIDALADSLRRLRDAVAPVSKGGMGLAALSNSLKKFNDSLTGLSNLSLAKEKIQGITDALKPLESVQKSGFSSLASGLDKLVKVAPQLEAVTATLEKTNLNDFAAQCNRVAAAITPLATQMEKVAEGFKAFPAKIQRLLSGNTSLTASNAKLTASYVNLAAKIAVAYTAIKRIARAVAQMMSEAIEWDGIAQRFNRSFGEYAQDAYSWIQRLNKEMYINTQQFMQYSSVFASMLKGYGVNQRDAATMATGYMELAYDIWAGFNDIYSSLEDSATAIRSVIAGEVEPIRKAGFTIVDSQLAITAANHGVAYSTQGATEEMKSYLRYLTLIDQARAQGLIGTYAREMNTAEGLMRTLKQQLISLAQAFGSVFLPILAAVLPYIQAFVQLITMAIQAVAALFGIDFKPVSFGGGGGGLGAAAETAEELGDNLGGAGKEAKKLKDYLLGIDELNVLKPEEDNGGGGSGVGGIGGGGGGFDVSSLWDETIFDEINSKVAEIVEKVKEWCGLNKEINSWADFFDTRIGKILETVGAIAAGFAAWKISESLIKLIDKLKGFKLEGGGIGLLGLVMLVADLKELTKYFEDILDNGANFQNVTGLLSEFIGAIGDCALLLGNIELGGALKAIQGVGELAVAVKDIAESGVDWDNATTAIRGLTNIAIGIGLLTKNIKVAAWSVAIQGLTTIIGELSANWEAIKQGDWSGVDKVTLIIGGLEILGGLVVALDVFSKLKGLASMNDASKSLQTVTQATGSLDTAIGGSGGLTTKLTSLVKNIGLGVVIIAEVAAAALIITGAIALMGWELEQVGKAWQPVIDNASTVAIAMGIGTGVLVVVGAICYALGTAGTAVALNIAIGAAILLELGVAAALFIAEIWLIGKGLDEIGKAWQPVLDNGETIATGIGLGTALLIGIGVVTAALGAATVASAGLLPLAIALGTAILVELAAAFVLFTESLVAVADELSDRLSPALDKLNGKLPDLSTNMSDFVDFMTEFAGEVVRYTEVSAIAGLSATIDTIIGWFTQDPIEKLADDVETITEQTTDLNEKLRLAVPELEAARDLLKDYAKFLSEIQSLTGTNFNLSTEMFVNMKEVGQKLVTGLEDGIKSKSTALNNAAKDLIKGFNTSFETSLNSNKTMFNSFVTTVTSSFESLRANIVNKLSQAKQAVQNAWGTVGAWFGSSVATPIHTKLQTLSTNIQNSFAKAKQAVQNAWGTLPTWFGTNIVTPMLDKMRNETEWYNAGRTAMDAWVRGLKSIEMPKFHVSWTTDRKSYTANGKTYWVDIPVPDIRFYAMGGFPNSGELFVAREAGAEMVGSIGGRAAVANNDQIVEAVALGVYEAMTAAMSNDSQDGNTKIVINLDGQKIYENQQKIARGKGYNLGMGAFA